MIRYDKGIKILGISAFYHDSAAAVMESENIIAAAQEERFTRRKHDSCFPTNAIRFCLKYAGLSLGELDAIAFYDKPLLKFERLLETYYAFSPKGLRSFIAAMPVWIKEKMFLKNILHSELKKIEQYNAKEMKLLFPEHHLSHASSAFFSSSYQRAAILTIDGVGEWTTASICLGEKNRIKILKELSFPHSLGLLYSAFTYFLGFKVNSGEYKLMGLAPYGNSKSTQIAEYIKIIKTYLVTIKKDGSIWLNQKYFNYATGLKMVFEKKWKNLFGFPRRDSSDNLLVCHCNLALAIQHITEEIVIKMAKHAKELTGAEYLCMAGGVALNCVANGKLVRENFFKRIFIQPAAGDAGGALGAAQSAYYIYFNQNRTESKAADRIKGSYLGPEFSDLDIKLSARKFKAKSTYYSDFLEMANQVAQLIAKGNVVGWIQGRMEFGPRALGARSILGDARNPEMQKKLNLKIKYRESFRPFAPSVLAEDYSDFFEYESDSPYMLMVHPVLESRRKELPHNFYELPLKERLYHLRSDIPAVTHIDFSARIQTVHKDTNPRYWELINLFKQKTGYGLIVNTSFNVRGEPIVCTPEHAYRCFMRTEMDYLVIGNFLFNKKEQSKWDKKDHWQEEFQLD